MGTARGVVRGVARGVTRGLVMGRASGGGIYSSSSVNTAGTQLTVTYAEAVDSAEELTLLFSRGDITATYLSGETTTSIVYTLSRVVYSDEYCLSNGTAYSAEKATNNSTQIAPDAYRTFTKGGTISTENHTYFVSTLGNLSSAPGTSTHYFAYTSTDHAAGAGGIYCWCCLKSEDATDATKWKGTDAAATAGEFDYLDVADRPSTGSNLIFTDSTQGDQTETPCVRWVTDFGGVADDDRFVLTYHNANLTGYSNGQRTMLATGNFPWEFTRYDAQGPGDAVILDTVVTVGDANHTGYFVWYESPFSEFKDSLGAAYRFWGRSLYGGYSAIWGSQDALNWDFVTLSEHVRYESFATSYHLTPLPRGAVDINGEIAAVGTLGERGSGISVKETVPMEFYLSQDGVTLTREPTETLLALGSSGVTNDDTEITPADTPITLADGTEVWLYTGATSVAGTNALMLATATINAGANKTNGAIEQRPAHDKTYWNFPDEGSVPSEILKTTALNLSIDGTYGLLIPATSGTAGVKWASNIDPTTSDYVEMNCWGVRRASSGSTLRMACGNDWQVFEDGVLGLTYGSIEPNPRMIEEQANVSYESFIDTDRDWGVHGTVDTHIRWDVSSNLAWLPTVSGENRRTTITPERDFSGESFVFGLEMTGINTYIREMAFRFGNANGNTLPTITATTTSPTSLTFSLSAACVGNMDGVTIKVDGVAKSGVWTRSSSTSYVFNAASGTFASGQTITYDIASSDVRTIEDNVAAKNVTGASVTNSL